MPTFENSKAEENTSIVIARPCSFDTLQSDIFLHVVAIEVKFVFVVCLFQRQCVPRVLDGQCAHSPSALTEIPLAGL